MANKVYIYGTRGFVKFRESTGPIQFDRHDDNGWSRDTGFEVYDPKTSTWHTVYQTMEDMYNGLDPLENFCPYHLAEIL